MSLFKKMTDPTPGGGLTGSDPVLRAPDPQIDEAIGGIVVDPTALIMGGIRGRGRIDAVRRAHKEINLQPTFDVELTVFAEDGEFTAHVIQPVIEDLQGLAAAGQEISLKYSDSDRTQVWIDWSGSAAE
jgi:hypothetical protein